jgi:hypothetical protein
MLADVFGTSVTGQDNPNERGTSPHARLTAESAERPVVRETITQGSSSVIGLPASDQRGQVESTSAYDDAPVSVARRTADSDAHSREPADIERFGHLAADGANGVSAESGRSQIAGHDDARVAGQSDSRHTTADNDGRNGDSRYADEIDESFRLLTGWFDLL